MVLFPPQVRQEFAVDAVEAAVAEDDDDIAAAGFLGDVVDDGISIGEIMGFLAERF